MKILAVDFGSTYTKVSAIEKVVIGTAKAFTTIETDIRDGLNAALAELEKQTGKLDFDAKLASSSAGGGLKMVAVGLVPSLTAKAALLAAESAGAKVVKTYAYELAPAEQEEIFGIKPDLVLLSGGTDGGNKEAVLHNAKKLAEIEGDFAVIAAGNKTVQSDVARILEGAGKHTVTVRNVMPALGQLDIMPAKEAIRSLFMERIVEAKGLGEAAKMMSLPIVPTPLAVLWAAELLATEIGSLVAVDIGGATTDVYSITEGATTRRGVIQKGLPEPYAKRSVEGDLGMRYSLGSLIGAEPKNEGCDAFLAKCIQDPSYVPKPGSDDAAMDAALCAKAARIAINRHSGSLERVFTPMGETYYQTGKDLTNVKHIVGIGGAIVYADSPGRILQTALAGDDPLCLLPKAPGFLFDKKYIFAAMGLLSQTNKELAVKIMQREVLP